MAEMNEFHSKIKKVPGIRQLPVNVSYYKICQMKLNDNYLLLISLEKSAGQQATMKLACNRLSIYAKMMEEKRPCFCSEEACSLRASELVQQY